MKVSVLMLAYNQERYIDEAIRSVMLQQTDFPFELVIGNDASTDDTGAVCELWRSMYPDRVVLINRPENIGLIANFMQTYAQCRGKYVAICEGDDFWTDRHKLQRQVDYLEAHPDYSACFHRVINYYEDRGTKSLSNGGQRRDTDIRDLARSNYISNVSVLFRRGLFGDFPEWFAQVSTYDYALHMLNAQYGKLHYMRRPMAVYRRHGGAIWSEAGAERQLDIALTVREKLMEHFRRQGNTEVYDLLRGAHTQICLNLIRHYEQHTQGIPRADGISRTEIRLLRYRPEWTLQQVFEHEKTPEPDPTSRIGTRIRRTLTCVREALSRYLPLPRIH